MGNAIEVIDLVKVYRQVQLNQAKSVKALEGVSFYVPRGRLFGLIGLNGAGKTTLVKILVGLVGATSGSASVFGNAVGKSGPRAAMGYLPETFGPEKDTTVFQFLSFIAGVYGLKRQALRGAINSLVDEFDLGSFLNKKLNNLSKGMLRRVGIAQTLIGNPELIILDEPTDGLDPIWRKRVRDTLLRLKNDGVTIVLNSHMLSEVELMADEVAMIQTGKILYSGTLSALMPRTEHFQVGISEYPSNGSEYNFKRDKDIWVYETDSPFDLEKCVSALNSKGVPISFIRSTQPTLEGLFLHYLSKRGA